MVAITGMGMVTPLGTGKADNWKKLTAGKSGIRAITRFATEGLRTTIAGTVDHVYENGMVSAQLSEKLALLAGTEAIEEASIGAKGKFPGPLFLALPPIEIEWSQRFALAEASGANEKIDYGDLVRVAAKQQFSGFYEISKYGIVAEHQRQGYATEAVHGLVAHAFRRPEVERVIAETLPELVASIGVLAKCGFEPIDERSEPGVVRYALTRAAWR